jgi:hydroxypyruvate isomerase
MNRRLALKTMTTTAATAFVSESLTTRLGATNAVLDATTAGKINHSACRWCYSTVPLEELCKRGKEIGLSAIDLLKPEEWATAAKYGLQSSMGSTVPNDSFMIKKGFNRVENHKILVEYYENMIPQAAKAGLKTIICFSGNREGLSDVQGLANCAMGLKQLMKTAEKNNITLCMELLNSKIDHKDYQCDRTDWGAALVKSIGSTGFSLLYDIYHMQIMEGDVIRTIKEYAPYIAHYHTGGVPGRNEIDDSQELYYPAIMKAIAETGYKGFVAQEFIPKNADKLASLDKCVKICNI